MSFFSDHLLSLIVLLPLMGAFIALSFPRTEHSGVRGFALAITLVDFALSIWMWLRFDSGQTAMQMVERIEWIPSFGISYALGVDGMSVLLVLLTTFLAPIVILSMYSGVKSRVREYIVCLLLLQTGMLGAFVAIDLFLFYVFWELMLIPMYFLIGIWGGPRRVYAALKFFLYTMAGSLLMLVAILYTVWAVRDAGGLTFDWNEVATRLGRTDLGGAEIWLFLAFAVAFAIKVPMFPFHTWLPDAHVEAPTGGSVILAGVLLKLGTFGFVRYAFWLYPQAAGEFLPALGLIAVIGVIYGALVSMVQKDLKRLVAYSSVSHLGFVMLGLAALTVTGVTGGVIQMVNHGISTGALFLLVGVIYERRHTRMIADYGGLAKVMPWFAFSWMLITLSSIGVPGLNGFVGEFLILLGAFQSQGIAVTTATGDVAWAGIIAVEAVALGAVVLVALSITRVSSAKVGRVTKLLAVVLAAAAAVVLTAPPVGDFHGGLLVRPLAAVAGGAEAFAEIFATFAVIAASGVIFAAVYLLWATQRVFFGEVSHPENEKLKDLSTREKLVLAPLCIMAILIGVYPQPFLEAVEPQVQVFAQRVRERADLPAVVVTTRPAKRPSRPARLPAIEDRERGRIRPQLLRPGRVPPYKQRLRDRIQRRRPNP